MQSNGYYARTHKYGQKGKQNRQWYLGSRSRLSLSCPGAAWGPRCTPLWPLRALGPTRCPAPSPSSSQTPPCCPQSASQRIGSVTRQVETWRILQQDTPAHHWWISDSKTAPWLVGGCLAFKPATLPSPHIGFSWVGGDESKRQDRLPIKVLQADLYLPQVGCCLSRIDSMAHSQLEQL